MNVILGLDLSTVSTGAVVISSKFGDDPESVQCLATKTFKVNSRDRLTIGEKCLFMSTEISKLIEKHKVTTVAIEDVYYTKFIKVYKALCMVHGAVAAEVAHHGLPMEWYTASAARKLVFSEGGIFKTEVQEKLNERFHFKNQLPIAQWTNDQSDALTVALAHETVLYGKHVSFQRFRES